ATADTFSIDIIGEGGHGAHPHMSVDSIAITGEIITSLQQIVSRNIDPTDPIIITIGTIEGGYNNNVIVTNAHFEETVRMLNPKLRAKIKSTMDNYISGITKGMGADFKFQYYEGVGSVYVDEKLLPVLENTSDKVLGKNKYTYIKSGMGGEDFSYFTDVIPGVFFRLGIYNEEKNCIYPN